MLYASYKNKQAQIVAIHKFSVVFTFCLATLALWLARNDGHKESTLCYFAMTANFVILSFR